MMERHVPPASLKSDRKSAISIPKDVPHGFEVPPVSEGVLIREIRGERRSGWRNRRKSIRKEPEEENHVLRAQHT